MLQSIQQHCCQQIKFCFIFLGEVCMCVMLKKLFTIPLLVVLFLPKGLFQKPVFKTSWFVFVKNVHAFEEPTCVDLFICYAMERTVNTFHDYSDVFVPYSTTLLSFTPYWFLLCMSSVTTLCCLHSVFVWISTWYFAWSGLVFVLFCFDSVLRKYFFADFGKV